MQQEIKEGGHELHTMNSTPFLPIYPPLLLSTLLCSLNFILSELFPAYNHSLALIPSSTSH